MDQPQILGDRYQLAQLLGRGGMAEVHEALDLRLNRSVAVKQLSLQLASDPSAQQRFRREAQAVARLQHPAIATVYDSGEEPDPDTGVVVPYIVMELVDGSTLRDLLRSGDQLEPARALAIVRDILGALGHSHRAGIVHRDVKPANVMINSAGHVKVMDFGIARAADDTTGLTQTSAVIGTAQYLSPEQARGEPVDQRSDLYSAGCLLYELLVARTPFVGDSSISVAYQHVRETPDPPSRHNPLLGPDIDTVVLKALAKDPADRYQSADEMAADLTRLIDGQPVLASGPVEASTTLPRARVTPPVVVDPTAPTAVQSVQDVPPVRPSPAPLAAATGNRALTQEPERRSGVPRTLLVLALVLLIGGGIFGAYRLLGSGGGSTPGGTGSSNQAGITVPDGLVGRDIQDVKKTLKQAGFTNVNPEKSSDEPKGTKDQVLAIDPKPGTVVAPDVEIVVIYQGSSGSGSDDETTRPPTTTEPSTPASTNEPTSTKPSPTKSTSEPKPSDTKTSSKPSASSSSSASSGSGTVKPSKTPKVRKAVRSKIAKAIKSHRASPTPKP